MVRPLTILALFCSVSLFAQPIQTKRIEFPEKEINKYGCITFEQDGLLIKTENDNKQESKKVKVITYEKYDTTLQKVASIDVSLPAKHMAYEVFTNETMQYDMMYKKSGEYTISALSVKDMHTKTIQGKMPKNTSVSYLRAVGDYVYILGVTKDLPMLLCQNIQTGETSFGKIIPLNKRNFEIISFEINEDTQEVYLFTKDIAKNEKIVKFYVYKDGKKTNEMLLKSTDEDKYIVSAFASHLKDGSYLISGTYGNNSNKRSVTSTGIFIMNKGINGETKFLKYINYLDIKNFTSYLSERKQEKIEKKAEKKAAQNKEYEINYLMTPHNIIEQNGEYVLVGEAFYPTYEQRCEYYTGANGTQTMRCYQVFDGYQYTHYFMLGFDNQGQTLWSNSAPLGIIEKPFQVVHYLSINQNNPFVQIIYSTWNSIILHNYKAGEEVSNNTILFTEENEKLLNSISRTSSWYKDTFISYGRQKIKDKEEHEKREIFFIEKIQIAPTH